MSEVSTKAKSAIYHLETALSGLEKAQIHLLQARTCLPKGDEKGRAAVEFAGEALVTFNELVTKAVEVVTEENPAKPKTE